MGSWGVKALESDNGLDVLNAVRELAAGRAAVTADELVAALRAEGFLGEDPAEDEYLYDVTALGLAEILTGDTDQLTPDTLGATTFERTPEGTAVLVDWLTRIRDADAEEREIVELWDGDEAFAAHVGARLAALTAGAVDPTR